MLRPMALLAVGLLVLSVSEGCSDVVNPGTSRTQDLKPRHFTSTTDGSTVTVIDADGTSFTFDPAAQEVRASDGTVMELASSDLSCTRFQRHLI